MLCVGASLAGDVVIGQPLPRVVLDDGAGELVYEGGEHVYRKWDSSDLPHKVHVLYMVAARMGADKINQPFQDALIEAGGLAFFSKAQYSIISVLNLNDVFPMGGMIARKAFEHERTLSKNDHAEFVLDENGALWDAWDLQPRSAAVIILDRDGKVLRFKDGALTDDEIVDYVQLLKDLKQGE